MKQPRYNINQNSILCSYRFQIVLLTFHIYLNEMLKQNISVVAVEYN